MGVPRGTTPTLALTIDDETIDLTLAEAVFVTISQKGQSLTKTGADITVDQQEVDVYLSQAETLAFSRGPVSVQLNWIYGDGARAATDVARFDMTTQLLERVLPEVPDAAD